MNAAEYNRRIAGKIKALRELRRMKQFEISDAINIERSVFSKMENGEITICIGVLKGISVALQTSVFQIIAIAEADIFIDFRLTPLSEILIRYTSFMEFKQDSGQLSIEELEFILIKMKQTYDATA